MPMTSLESENNDGEAEAEAKRTLEATDILSPGFSPFAKA